MYLFCVLDKDNIKEWLNDYFMTELGLDSDFLNQKAIYLIRKLDLYIIFWELTLSINCKKCIQFLSFRPGREKLEILI